MSRDFDDNNLPAREEGVFRQASAINPWFTSDNILHGIRYWATVLNEGSLEKWLSGYEPESPPQAKTIGLITAGNIPFAGLHDLLCTYLTGHRAVVKTSSDDPVLTRWMVSLLSEIDPNVVRQLVFQDRLSDIDAVIATGSNNSARYFEYYFGKYPHIIRKNRNSIAVITPETTDEQLRRLADDVFVYFGLGCRSVSKIYLPHTFDIQRIFAAFYDWKHIIQHHRYASNYDYNRVIYMMGNEPILENGFFILRHNSDLATPVSVVHYEFYESEKQVKANIDDKRSSIQCVVGTLNEVCTDDFGHAQWPSLDTYADGVDTLKFLLSV
ncbi:MAG: acyl-CoA reductase [Thermaurantimonas sp.]